MKLFRVSNLVINLQHCGIDKLIPFMEIDDYLFEPCGYSMNGILPNVSQKLFGFVPYSITKSSELRLHFAHYTQPFVLVDFQGSYMTIHVTPEPEFSYVSFETNVPLATYEELIRRVVKTFQPGKFIVTLMANQVRSVAFLLLKSFI